MTVRKRPSFDDFGPLFGGLAGAPPSATADTVRTVPDSVSASPPPALPALGGGGDGVSSAMPEPSSLRGAKRTPSRPKTGKPRTGVSRESATHPQPSTVRSPNAVARAGELAAPLGEQAVTAPAIAEGPQVLSVAGLAALVRGTLEQGFPVAVWVEGEVVGAKFAPSGHLYFTLKDETVEAAVDVVMYRGSLTPHSRTVVKDGAKVRLRGKPVFWAPRGRMQFVGDAVEPTGQGALLLALAQLKQKLTQEGLFDADRKRPLPEAPRIIGVVTSRTGAVIHDIRKVAFRRGGAHILLAPALVQGQGAAESIRKALLMLQRVAGVDVIIVGRGGGSSDDLMCFNDEALVRAVAASPIPIVSAVGHEVDVTLTDHAADRRAATPSQAAEFVVPDRAAQAALLRERTSRVVRAMRQRASRLRLQVTGQAKSLRDPRVVLAVAQQRLDDRRMRMQSAMERRLRAVRDVVAKRRERLAQRDPRHVLAEARAKHVALGQRLLATMQGLLREARAEHELALRSLDALSPLRVLARGYALATTVPAAPHQRATIVQNASNVNVGAQLRVRLASGALLVQVLGTEAGPSLPGAADPAPR